MRYRNATITFILLVLLSVTFEVRAGWVYEPDKMHFDVIDLGSHSPSDQCTGAYSVNDYGQVVASIPLEQILFDAMGQSDYVHLGFHLGPMPEAICINDAAQIVLSTGEQSRATLREPTGETVEIGAMESYGFSINNLGQVVGSDGFPFIRAMLFDVTGQGNNINLDPFLETPHTSWAACGCEDAGLADCEMSRGCITGAFRRR